MYHKRFGSIGMQFYKRGELVIEGLVALALNSGLISLVVSVFLLLANIRIPQVHQHEIFALQLRQLLSRSAHVHSVGDAIVFNHDLQSFTIRWDRHRIVKEPGYEILLEGVRGFNIEGNVIRYCLDRGCYDI